MQHLQESLWVKNCQNVIHFKKVMDINCNGVFYVLQSVANIMKGDGGGVIVNTASMAAHSGPPNMIMSSNSNDLSFVVPL